MITGNEIDLKAQKPVRMIYVRKMKIKLIIKVGGCRAEGSLSALSHPSLPLHAT
jgi:hypothetical protein